MKDVLVMRLPYSAFKESVGADKTRYGHTEYAAENVRCVNIGRLVAVCSFKVLLKMNYMLSTAGSHAYSAYVGMTGREQRPAGDRSLCLSHYVVHLAFPLYSTRATQPSLLGMNVLLLLYWRSCFG